MPRNFFTNIVFLSGFVIILISNAELSAGTFQYALTGGTNGLGLKYTFRFKRVHFDIGVPVYFRIKHQTVEDTIVNGILFESDIYFSGNVIIYEKGKTQISTGIMLFNTVGYERIDKKFENRPVEEDSSNDFYLDIALGPVAEYARMDEKGRRIFGVQIAPVRLPFRNDIEYDVKLGAQLDFYFDRLR